MPSFARLEIWSNYECASGVRLAIVPVVVSLSTTRDVAGDESVEFSIPRNSSALTAIDARRVIRILRRDAIGTESYDEWRLNRLTDVSGANGAVYSYQARSPLFDLANGDIALPLSTGESLHAFNVVNLTPSQIIDAYVLPSLAASGYGYFARGTVDPNAPLDMSFEWTSALALLQQLRDQTNAELRIRRNGTTGYYIDLLTQIGAGASMPTLRSRKNLVGNQRLRQTDTLVTRVVPKGLTPSGTAEAATIARMMFVVSAVSGSTITIQDPSGAVLPIAFDDQFNGWALMREKTGGTFTINDTVKATQQLVLSSASDIAVGEFVQLRVSDAHTARVAAAPIAPRFGAAFFPYVSHVDPAGLLFTLADIGGVGAPDWCAYDGQYVDQYLVAHFVTLDDAGATWDGANGRVIASVSVAAVAAGDLLYTLGPGGAVNPPYGVSVSSILWEVTSVDVANKYLYLKPHYSINAGVSIPSAGGIRVVVSREFGSARIVASVASTNILTLDGSLKPPGNAIVLIEQRSAGVLPTYVDSPIGVAAYGIVPRPLDRTTLRGEANVVQNPRFRTWTTPVNPPDAWSVAGASPEHSQNTNPAYIRYGAKSWALTIIGQPRFTEAISPVFYLNSVNYSDLSRCVIKVSLYLLAFQSDVSMTFRLETGDGGVTTNLLTIGSPDSSTVSDPKLKYAAGQWLDFTFAVDYSFFSGAETRNRGGYRIRIVGTQQVAASLAKIFLDSIAVYQVAYDPGSGVYTEGSFANQLLNQANAQLLAYGQPSIEYSPKIIDLERVPRAPFSLDALTLGGQVDLRDPDLSIVDTPRLSRMTIDELRPDNTQLTLATLQPRLSTLLAEGAV